MKTVLYWKLEKFDMDHKRKMTQSLFNQQIIAIIMTRRLKKKKKRPKINSDSKFSLLKKKVGEGNTVIKWISSKKPIKNQERQKVPNTSWEVAAIYVYKKIVVAISLKMNIRCLCLHEIKKNLVLTDNLIYM